MTDIRKTQGHNYVFNTNKKHNVQTKKEEIISTVSGKFYSGMTKAEAQKRSIFQSKEGQNFNDIDRNKDGKLSAHEIIAERGKEIGEMLKDSNANMGIGALEIAGATLGIMASSGTTLGLNVPFIAGGGYLFVHGLDDNFKALDELNKTKAYMKKHNIK